MPLSSRIIKSVQTETTESNDWVIDTTYEYEEEAEDNFLEPNIEAADELALARQKSDLLLKSAQTEKERLFEEAEAEIRLIKEEAYEKAFAEGQLAGYEKGYAEGKSDGYQSGQLESQELVDQARQTITEAQLDIEAYIEEKKDSLLSLSIHMAEKIVQEQLDLLPDGILELVNPILHQLDHKEDYVSLTVHSSKRLEIREKLPYLEKNYPGVRFVVFGDDNIDALGCVVESAHKVVDLQVKNQLEAMVMEMKEREREM